MKKLLTFGLGILVGYLAFLVPSPAHPAPVATASDPAPLVRQGKEARKTRAAVRERKCLSRPSYKRAFHQIRAPWRHAAVHGHRAKLRRDLARASRCNSLTYWLGYYFGSRAGEAYAVVKCETGGTFSVYASNGQYLGLFQMGSSERATYGHGYTVQAQVAAAYRYFVASGRDWSPWQCRPWGLAW